MLAFHLFRDRVFIAHRWRRRRALARGDINAHLIPGEPDGYIADALSPDERAKLPIQMALAAVAGAGFFAGVESESNALLFLVLAGVSVIAIFRLLAKDSALVLDVDAGEAPEPIGLLERLREIGLELWALAMLAFALLDPVSKMVWSWIVQYPVMAWSVFAVGLGLIGLAWLLERDEGTELPRWRSLDLTRETAFAAVAALALAGVAAQVITNM